jgi:arsenate reductase-like glutaredoxin family protein
MDDRQAQIFGVRKSADTRKALRFFAERRVKTHFVDFAVRGPSAGELRRFCQKFGAATLVDRDAPRFADLGLRAAQLGEERWLDTMIADPLLLRMPLVRFGTHLSVGPDEAAWRSWFS